MKKTLIIIVVIVILGGFAYKFFTKSAEDDASLVSNKDSSIKVGADLLAALATLDTLKLDTEFFKDITFKRLTKFSQDIPQQPKGRTNPFAPIGGANIPATTTNTR